MSRITIETIVHVIEQLKLFKPGAFFLIDTDQKNFTIKVDHPDEIMTQFVIHTNDINKVIPLLLKGIEEIRIYKQDYLVANDEIIINYLNTTEDKWELTTSKILEIDILENGNVIIPGGTMIEVDFDKLKTNKPNDPYMWKMVGLAVEAAKDREAKISTIKLGGILWGGNEI
jgi:hypothetical protein